LEGKRKEQIGGAEMTRNAQIRDLKPGAGKTWWQTHLSARWPDIERRFQESRVVYWSPGNSMPLELFAYLREASLCFSMGRFLATLSLSGALVEVILNKDPRLAKRSDLRRIGNWILLNNNNLAIAKSEGLPVSELLDSGENPHAPDAIRFVDSRNKIAHGDLATYQPDLPERNPEWEREARDQLQKAMRFLVSWFNSAVAI